MHYHRARQLRRRRVSAYEDRRGATLLFVVMTVAVLANLVVNLVHLFDRFESDRFQYTPNAGGSEKLSQGENPGAASEEPNPGLQHLQ